ncbi:acyltransferase family protein [Pseudoneobacillus sp. C159]
MKTRDSYYDNVKLFLIFLVVFGHFIQTYVHENQLIYTIYTTIYTFHMPAFILISGYFAKGFQQKGYLMKITKKLLIPYIIFQGIYTIFYFVYSGQKAELDPFQPHWSLWFLLSLFCWNLMLFLFSKWKPWYALSCSVVLGIIIGYVNEINSYMSLSRTIVFFPFFLVGYFLKKEHFEKIRSAKIPSLFVLLSIFIAVYFLPDFNYKWLFGSKPYGDLIDTNEFGGIIRFAIYSLSIVATICFLAMVPKGRYFFTKWGASSFYVYLLHGFFVKTFRHSKWTEYLDNAEQIVVLLIISIILVVLLSSKPVKKMLRPIF